jgi:DNA-binding transcriptional LysR family regulator
MAINISLKQLRALSVVAETHSFTAAAQRLHTTQSALSGSISQLEQALGLKLIDRTTRRFALTAAGTEFLPAVTRILGDLNTSITNLATLATLKRGTVTLACPPALAAALLPAPISSFRKLYPHVHIVLKDSASGPSLAKLMSGEVEIAVGALTRSAPDLNVIPLVKDRLIALAPKDWPVGRAETVTWRALGEHPIIAPSRESSTREIIERTYEKATGKTFAAVLETAYWLTTIAMVEAGMGVAVAPSHAITHLSSSRVRTLRLTQPVVDRDIHVMSHSGRLLSPAANAFIQHLLEATKR